MQLLKVWLKRYLWQKFKNRSFKDDAPFDPVVVVMQAEKRPITSLQVNSNGLKANCSEGYVSRA